MKFLLSAILVILLFTAAIGADAIKTVDQPRDIPSFLGYAQDRFIVVMKEEVGKMKMQMTATSVVHIGDTEFDKISDKYSVSNIQQQFPGSEFKAPELAKFHKVYFNAGTLDEAMDAYSQHPMVERVEPVGIHAVYATPNDT